jgi:diguanylate cyclase (GGDEF)-like protein
VTSVEPPPVGPTPAAELQNLLTQSEDALRSGQCAHGAEQARRASRLASELGDLAAAAKALSLLAQQLTRMGEFELCAAACDQAAAILRDLGDQAGLGEILIVQALALNQLGLSEEALDVLAVGREVAVRLNDPTLLYWVLNRIAVVHAGLQDHSRAQDFQLRALALSVGLDEDARFCIVNNLADNAVGLCGELREQGNDHAAAQALRDGLRWAEEAVELAIATKNPYRQALALDNGGMLLALAGDHAAALERLETARILAHERGYQSMEAGACYHQASVLLLQGQATEAVPALETMLDRATELGEPHLQLRVLKDLCSALEQTSQFEQALHRLREFMAVERQSRTAVAAIRARMLVHLVDLDSARLDAADARIESDLLRARSRELEREKQDLERRAAELDRRVNEDALTRLRSRHYLETALPRLYAETAAQGLSLAVVVLDIDHFKQVNDGFGHAVGDAVLVQVAELLTQGRRTGDLVGRLGGEEFLLAFPGVDEQTAVEVCERLRQSIELHHWGALRSGLRVTVSLGVCARSDESDVEELVERADARMYRAKRAGRNRVEWYTGLGSAS